MTGINILCKPKLVLTVLILCLINLKAMPQDKEPWPEATQKASEATVGIFCNGGVTTGSGSVVGISPEGGMLILTTLDVVSTNSAEAGANTPLDFYDKIVVKLPGSAELFVAKALPKFVDRSTHMALIGIRSGLPPNREVVRYDRNGKVKLGEKRAVFAFSEPTGQQTTATNRIISLTDKFLMFESPFPTGSSGSPVVDKEGRMIGIVTSSTTSEGDQLKQAVRIKAASPVVNKWLDELSGLKLKWREEGGVVFTPWIIGGAAVAAGGTTLLLINGGDDDGGGFPRPPVRPAGN